MFENTQELTPDDDSEKQFKFYYNREKRIANAPQIVQDYYNGKMKPVRGIKIFFQKQKNRIKENKNGGSDYESVQVRKLRQRRRRHHRRLQGRPADEALCGPHHDPRRLL